MAANPKPFTASFDAPREHRSFRLFAPIIAVIEDIAKGVEAGEAGLKSCGAADISSSCGVSRTDAASMDRRDAVLLADEDECFDAIGTYLANGFSHAEIAKMVRLDGGATHLLALERWCDRVHLECDADFLRTSEHASFPWSGSGLHERRRRGHRAMTLLRATDEGIRHASVLHVVYGWADPFVNSLPIEVVAALGRELVPLARYTDAVEERRVEMVRAEAAKREHAPYVHRLERGEDPTVKFSEVLNAMGEKAEMFRLAAKHAPKGATPRKTMTRDESADLFDLERRRSLLAWSDRCLTSGDALRSAASSFNEPNPPQHEDESRAAYESRKHAREERKQRHNERTDAFLLSVKLEADRMLKDASLAFQDAWFRSRGES